MSATSIKSIPREKMSARQQSWKMLLYDQLLKRSSFRREKNPWGPLGNVGNLLHYWKPGRKTCQHQFSVSYSHSLWTDLTSPNQCLQLLQRLLRQWCSKGSSWPAVHLSFSFLSTHDKDVNSFCLPFMMRNTSFWGVFFSNTSTL